MLEILVYNSADSDICNTVLLLVAVLFLYTTLVIGLSGHSLKATCFSTQKKAASERRDLTDVAVERFNYVKVYHDE